MGKKKYNAKARRNPETIVDNSAVKSIKIDGVDDVHSNGSIPTGYDEANALALPSKKRATKIKIEKRKVEKILTKKQRKNLQSIVDKKKKKEGREQLLKDLAAVQISETELNQYTSVSQAQTVGLKRLPKLDDYLAKKKERQAQQQIEKDQKKSGVQRVNALKGSKRKLLVEERADLEAKRINPNIINAEESEDEESEDEESEDEKSEDEESEDKESEDADDDTDTGHEEEEEKGKDKENQVELLAKGKQQQPFTNEEVAQKMQPEAGYKSRSGPAAASTPIHTYEEQQPVTNEEVAQKMQPTKPKPKAIRKTVHVPVNRTDEVQAARLRLPILAEEQQVMELINDYSVVIVAGETGSGKTTQIPQFLYEAGYAMNKMIGITEPRRVAAISMSKRVAYEMNLPSSEVSYLVRFEGNVTPDTRIKFMTDGVLLKEIETDFLLNKYSVIVLDEAHERTMNTDILIGLLSRIVRLRDKREHKLKLIIMSATLRVSDFTKNRQLFNVKPPVIKVEARQYPVTIHFQKHTPEDYVAEAFKKTLKIHSKLPDGGILIFVTGQQEVLQLVRKLRKAFPYQEQEQPVQQEQDQEQQPEMQQEEELEEQFDAKRPKQKSRKKKGKLPTNISLPKINLDDYKLAVEDTEADMYEQLSLQVVTTMGKKNETNEKDEEELDMDDLVNLQNAETKQPLWVLPLYSLLSSEKQQRIFEPVPDGCRLCVVATNIAETSLTIPHVKYVVDCGRQKTRVYDKITGVSTFVVTYTSKASADQRAGRAGRISAGHCYRLYSSAVYNDIFSDFSQPDILQKPVDDLMLKMRCMGIDRIINFPFPSPPKQAQLKAAEGRLLVLGALELSINPSNPPAVSSLGKTISCFPVAPCFGKMIALSRQYGLMPYTICIVAALSVQEVFTEDAAERQGFLWRGHGQYKLLGDPMVLLRVLSACEMIGRVGQLQQFCAINRMRTNAVVEARKLRLQLTNDINIHVPDLNLTVDHRLQPPSVEQARFLRQIILAGMGDKVGRKVPLDEISDKEERRRLQYAYNCGDMEEPAFIHKSSVLKYNIPNWIVYQEAFEIQNGDSKKMFLRGITAIEPEWLLTYVPHLCNVHEIYEEPAPRYVQNTGRIYCHVKVTFGKAGWELPLSEQEMPRSEKACCYFGMYLLDGLVCPPLAAFKPKLKTSPSSIIKSWSNLNDKVLRFKRALINKGVYSRQLIFDQWEMDPEFLLEEYHDLLYDVPLTDLSRIWPPTGNDD